MKRRRSTYLLKQKKGTRVRISHNSMHAQQLLRSAEGYSSSQSCILSCWWLLGLGLLTKMCTTVSLRCVALWYDEDVTAADADEDEWLCLPWWHGRAIAMRRMMNLLPKDSPVQRNCTDIWRIFARYSSSVHLLNNNGTAGEVGWGARGTSKRPAAVLKWTCSDVITSEGSVGSWIEWWCGRRMWN